MIYSSISTSLMAILEKLRIGDPNRIASLTVFFNNLGSFCNFSHSQLLFDNKCIR